MSFHLCAITATELPNETILDYTYISEENFLLVIALTSKGNLITYYKTGSTQKLETASAHELYHEWCEPVLVSITPDASVVILVQSDGSILMFPIKALIDVNWGVSNNICTAPTLVKIDQNNSEPIFRLPTCAVAFNSRFTNKPYIAYGNKAGKIFIVDLALRMQVASIGGDHSIHNIEYYLDGSNSYILVTHFVGAQVIIKVESDRCSVRETLAHVAVEEIDSIPDIKYSCQHSDGCITGLNAKNNQVNIYTSFDSIKQPRTSLKIPENTWLVHFNQKSLICVTESNTIFLRMHFLNKDNNKPCAIAVAKLDDRLLGFVPIVSMSDELDDCFFVTEKKMIICRPNMSINELALNCIAEEFFSAKMLEEIAFNLQRDSKDMTKTLLRVSLEKRSKGIENECEINGALALALEIQVEMENVIQILSDFNETDLIIPFLTAKCERDPKHWAALMEVYVVKLKRMIKQEDLSEKNVIEEQLKKCFTKCNASKENFKLMLKQEMWSCVCILLSKEPTMYSEMVASHLMEIPSLKGIRTNQLAQCLSFLLWSSIEPLAGPLLTKVCLCLYDIDSPSQLALFANIGETLLPKVPSAALMIYSISTINYLHSIHEDRSHSLDISPIPFAAGSNCAVAIGDDDTPYFWGEFTAGSLKFRTEPKKSNKTPIKTPKSPVNSSIHPTVIKTILHPEKLIVPSGNEPELRIVAAACGTQHVLLLTASGIVYSYGQNRFGQCGTGNKNPVLAPMPITNNYGRAKKIFSGHYHSALINEKNEVFLWGWSMYGQLALDMSIEQNDLESRTIPTKVTVLPMDVEIVSIALGYAHSLFLMSNGIVYGCGAVSFGQLAIDPQNLINVVEHLYSTKCKSLIHIPIAEPVKLVASGYFHSIAVGESGRIYQWGIAPHTLRMKAFLTKRFNSTTRTQQKKGSESTTLEKIEKKETIEDEKKSPPSCRSPTKKLKTDLGKEYMHVSIIHAWPSTASPIVQISAGYSHNALITADGELYTWGKSLDMQLGHGNKVEKDKPWKLLEPNDTKWKYVVAGRCTTMAVSSCGRLFVWGRNDKSQLGLGFTKKAEVQRKVFLRANKDSKAVELPNDNCVVKPTPLPGLQTALNQSITPSQREQALMIILQTADQHTLSQISRYLTKHPVPVFALVHIHLLAGDIYNAVDVLCSICEETNLLKEANSGSNSPGKNLTVVSPQRSLQSSIRSPRQEPNRNTPPLIPKTDDRNGNSPRRSSVAALQLPTKTPLEIFDELLDRIWALIRIHPLKEVQVLVLVRMLQSRFPIYNRLAADSRLCRLIDPFVDYPPPALTSTSSSVHSSDSAGTRKLVDMVVRERFTALKSAKVSSVNKVKAMRQKSENASNDQLRYYADCGHYEKCVVESGPAKAEFAAMRNRLRKCSRCVMKGKQV